LTSNLWHILANHKIADAFCEFSGKRKHHSIEDRKNPLKNVIRRFPLEVRSMTSLSPCPRLAPLPCLVRRQRVCAERVSIDVTLSTQAAGGLSGIRIS
jgi:hypothetical protein